MTVRAVHLAGRHGQALPRRDGPARRSRCACSRRARTATATTTRSSPASTTRRYAERFGDEFEHARRTTSSWLRGAAPAFDREAFLAGKQTPVFFGSAINNFGVREVLDALVDLAPPPQPRAGDAARGASPTRPKFTGVVFKIQANMDPAHRDRIAFVRVGSGHFERGMQLKVRALGQGAAARTRVVTFLSQRRELLDEAFAGDIIGIPEPRRAAARRHAHRRRGAAVHRPAVLRARDLPRPSRSLDPLRTKQLQHGPDAARRGRRDPGVPARGRRRRCCWAPSASCSSRWSRTA